MFLTVSLKQPFTHLVQGVWQQSVVAVFSKGLQGGQQLWTGAVCSICGDASVIDEHSVFRTFGQAGVFITHHFCQSCNLIRQVSKMPVRDPPVLLC